jgi:ElaB/YqjD/DUF883 family membrane-anchored ribosome-binding protein
MADEQPEVIRQQMDQTRASLTEKVEALENQVVGTVHNATTAVSETVDNVKQAVQDTVETVKETVTNTVEGVKEALDVTQQTQRHPWGMAGGAVAAGFITGFFLFRSRHAGAAWSEHAARAPAAPARPGWLDRLANRFSHELGQVEDAAFAALSSMAKEFVSQKLPHWIEEKVQETVAAAQAPHEKQQGPPGVGQPYRMGDFS